MPKDKNKLSPSQKRAKKKAKAEGQKKYIWVMMNGKQVKVKREPKINGIDIGQFVLEKADPIWLHQNEMWEYITTEESDEVAVDDEAESNEIPF